MIKTSHDKDEGRVARARRERVFSLTPVIFMLVNILEIRL